MLTQPGPGARKPETAHRLYTAGGRGEGGEQLSKSRGTRTLEEHVPRKPVGWSVNSAAAGFSLANEKRRRRQVCLEGPLVEGNISCMQKHRNVCSEEPDTVNSGCLWRTQEAGKENVTFTRCSYLLLYIYIHTHTHTHLFPLMNVSFSKQKIQKLLPWHRDPQVPPLLAH